MLNCMSDEEQYKYIEDKIIEAANASDHAFNEAAWKKMEAMLDQKKDKRRPFFWIFSALILGVLLWGAGIIYQAINKNDQSGNTAKQIADKNTDKQIPPLLSSADDVTTLPQTASPEKNTNNTNTAEDNYNAANKIIYKNKDRFALKITAPELENDQNRSQNKTEQDIDTYVLGTQKTIPHYNETGITKPETVNKPDTALKKIDAVAKTEGKKEKKKKSNAGFYVFAAGGMEANATRLLTVKNSSITPVYGVGLGYQFNRRLSVQTGFYADAKKYIAGPNDYTAKAGSYLSTVKIIKVDANCMVYQVPVAVQYNWLIRPKANYYAAVGVSSYIMKTEKYNYTFERNNIQYSYPYAYTKNSHLFASLQLSLGVEKQIGHKLLIQARPVVAIPLQGVGDGRVKIFTTGLHVGLKYFPFKQ